MFKHPMDRGGRRWYRTVFNCRAVPDRVVTFEHGCFLFASQLGRVVAGNLRIND
jgi:hypothetical protein